MDGFMLPTATEKIALFSPVVVKVFNLLQPPKTRNTPAERREPTRNRQDFTFSFLVHLRACRCGFFARVISRHFLRLAGVRIPTFYMKYNSDVPPGGEIVSERAFRARARRPSRESRRLCYS